MATNTQNRVDTDNNKTLGITILVIILAGILAYAIFGSNHNNTRIDRTDTGVTTTGTTNTGTTTTNTNQ